MTTPPQRGTLAHNWTCQVPLHWRGAPTPGPARRVAWVVRAGWLESPRNRTYSPLSSRAKRGDPVNKKALRAFARRHIALDCHNRTPTFLTLIVVLRNDSNICPAHMRGHYLHSTLSTLHSIIVTLCVTITSLCAQRVALWRGNERRKKKSPIGDFLICCIYSQSFTTRCATTIQNIAATLGRHTFADMYVLLP